MADVKKIGLRLAASYAKSLRGNEHMQTLEALVTRYKADEITHHEFGEQLDILGKIASDILLNEFNALADKLTNVAGESE